VLASLGATIRSIVEPGVLSTFPLPERPGFSIVSVGAPTASGPWPGRKYSILTMPRGSPINARTTPCIYHGLYETEGSER
jgi:hypothetical protein